MAEFNAGRKLGATLWGVFNVVAGTASILGLFFGIKWIPPGQTASVYAWYVIVLATGSLGYIVWLHNQKLHRYAQICDYVHFVNHTVRDVVSELLYRLENGTLTSLDEETKKATGDILNAIATTFSILTGTSCRACIKELSQESSMTYVEAYVRDQFSYKVQRGGPRCASERVPVSENSDFEEMLSNPRMRFFFENDLPRLWRRGKYRNSSLQGVIPKMFLGWIWGWPLPYKSTIVVPIRYVSGEQKTQYPAVGNQSQRRCYHYFGFLCIDSPRRNVFSTHYSVPLSSAFADVLYMFFSQLYPILNAATLPEQSRIRRADLDL
jgi:hypothetical protein